MICQCCNCKTIYYTDELNTVEDIFCKGNGIVAYEGKILICPHCDCTKFEIGINDEEDVDYYDNY